MDLARSAARMVHRLRLRALARRGRDAYPPGSVEWLILSEAWYGGFHKDVRRNRVSPLDPRPPQELQAGGMEGGDRMSPLHHGYARAYARHLAPFVRAGGELTLVEVGILRGTGLAVWSDLFPRAQVLGLDVDLSHYRGNEELLRGRGAFAAGNVRVAEFDQYAPDVGAVGALLAGRRIDVFIDDGCHADEAILRTLEAARGFLADRFVYFIEDNDTALPTLRARFPAYRYDRRGPLTVVTPA
jgi:hypothetical protein